MMRSSANEAKRVAKVWVHGIRFARAVPTVAIKTRYSDSGTVNPRDILDAMNSSRSGVRNGKKSMSCYCVHEGNSEEEQKKQYGSRFVEPKCHYIGP